MAKNITYSCFTKHWQKSSVAELIQLTKKLGCNGIELPVRKDYQVEPDNADKDLPGLAKAFDEQGLKVYSVASDTTEKVFAGCADANIPLIRIMYFADIKDPYHETYTRMRRSIEEFLPLCEKYGIKVGIQQHCGVSINSSVEMYHLVKDYDAKYVGGIWDASHSGLAGEETERSLDTIWGNLAGINFKNAFYRRITGPETTARYEPYFTTGDQGLCSWERAVNYLQARGYEGNVCLPMDYTDVKNVETYALKDAKYLKSLFANRGYESEVD